MFLEQENQPNIAICMQTGTYCLHCRVEFKTNWHWERMRWTKLHVFRMFSSLDTMNVFLTSATAKRENSKYGNGNMRGFTYKEIRINIRIRWSLHHFILQISYTNTTTSWCYNSTFSCIYHILLSGISSTNNKVEMNKHRSDSQFLKETVIS